MVLDNNNEYVYTNDIRRPETLSSLRRHYRIEPHSQGQHKEGTVNN